METTMDKFFIVTAHFIAWSSIIGSALPLIALFIFLLIKLIEHLGSGWDLFFIHGMIPLIGISFLLPLLSNICLIFGLMKKKALLIKICLIYWTIWGFLLIISFVIEIIQGRFKERLFGDDSLTTILDWLFLALNAAIFILSYLVVIKAMLIVKGQEAEMVAPKMGQIWPQQAAAGGQQTDHPPLQIQIDDGNNNGMAAPMGQTWPQQPAAGGQQTADSPLQIPIDDGNNDGTAASDEVKGME